MSGLKPKVCPITGDIKSNLVFSYDLPPPGEIGFLRSSEEPYYREIWQFLPGRHFLSLHEMKVVAEYDGAYMDATYKDFETMKATFSRIIGLKPENSDNFGRINGITNFAASWFSPDKKPNLLDVGSGLGVFPHAVKGVGWRCTAIDPDIRAVKHLTETIGVSSICGDFTKIKPIKKFDIVTINKVLEHVSNPIEMLLKSLEWVKSDGFVYIEVPDGEVASTFGPNREEFFIEHLHIFSLASTVILAQRSGFFVESISRICEPSGKYTLRAFLSPNRVKLIG